MSFRIFLCQQVTDISLSVEYHQMVYYLIHKVAVVGNDYDTALEVLQILFEQEATISMMKDWEFLSDRQLFWSVAWDMNGKLLNRIPLIKKLKWREYIAIKGVWGDLTSKNDPSKNINDEKLFKFPTNSYTFGKTPYWEFVAGKESGNLAHGSLRESINLPDNRLCQ